MINLKTFNIILFLLLSLSILVGQDGIPEKEIVIIEKTVDQDGNVIAQSTKRYSGHYSEDQIQEFIDDGPDIRSYDLDGLGFQENLRDLYKPRDSRPTIGVNLDLDNGKAEVEKVHPGSGAHKADVREGDIIISIANLPVSSIEDIHEALERKSKGDLIRIVIFRDGQEIEKEVQLSSSTQNNLPFNFNEGGGFRLFDNDDIGFSFDLDSLFEGFLGGDGLFEELNQGNRGLLRIEEDRGSEAERASLGVFIEDTDREVTVSEVIQDSPADISGVLAGDIILSLDGNIVTSYREVSAYMNRKRRGDTLLLKLKRDGSPMTLEVLLN